jgi:glycosyltransferase involved in cell wall biosynthesis
MSSVSVVVPCYDYARYLRGCVKSVLGQAGVDVRVLILDDCSPDNTPEVAAELVREDRRVEYRRHTVNQRHIATYNEGLAWASGDYTLLLSADDLLTSGALARAVRLLDVHSEIGLVWGQQIVFDTEVAPIDRPVREKDAYRVVDGQSFVAELCETGSNPVNTPTAIVRARLLGEVGGYRSELPHTADLELWLRCAARSAVGILDAEQAYKRMHGRNMQLDYTVGALRDLDGLKAAFDTFFRNDGGCVHDGQRLHAAALRALGERGFWAASAAFDRGDAASCRELLAFALANDSDLTSRREWARWRWKQRLGLRLWHLLRPVADWLRGRSVRGASGNEKKGRETQRKQASLGRHTPRTTHHALSTNHASGHLD